MKSCEYENCFFSVAFNISSSQANTNLPIRRFSQEHFLVSEYLSILHALYTHNSGFHI